MKSRDWQKESGKISLSAHEWAEKLQMKPFNNNNGMAPDTAFYLYYWIKEIKPKFIVESGAWRGFSTWVMRQAAPDAKIISLDPIFSLGYCLDKEKLALDIGQETLRERV